MAGVRLEMDENAVFARLKGNLQRAQKWLDNEVPKDCSPYVPFRTGMLEKSGKLGTKIGSGKVVYSAPYARRLYYGHGIRFNTAHHPQASAQWFEKAKAVKKPNWLNGAQEIAKGK